MATTWLIRNAQLLDLGASDREATLRPNTSVLVEGERVREVSDRPIQSNAAQVIDAAGRTLLPGFIDCHVHVVAASFNLAQVAQWPNVLAAYRAMPILQGMLMRGFTTVRDAGGADAAIARAVDEGLIEGPRIFPAGKALSQTGGHGDFRPRTDWLEPCACAFKVGSLARVVDGVDACRLAAREEILKGATQIKIMASGGVASPNDPIHFLGYSRDEIKAICEEAANADTYVMAHAYTGQAIRRAVECGVRTIEHGNLVDADAARAMVQHGALAVPTLITYEALAREGKALGLPDESVRKIEAAHAPALRSLEIFRDAGVKMAFGSDLLGESHRLQSEEFRIRAEILGNAAAMRAATLTAAQVLRREGELGVITAGAIADLLLVDGNPLREIAVLLGQGEHLPFIMKAGRVIKHDLR
jgi:imidazolonepropionase-like amidohydrolase